MKIVIDLQGAQTESRFRGIGRYTLSLAQAIVRNRQEHEVIIALNGIFTDTIDPIRDAFDGLLPRESIQVWEAVGPAFEADPSNKLNRQISELLREEFLRSLKADWILVSSLFEGLGDDAITSVGQLSSTAKTAVILYDLIPLISPDRHFRSSEIHKEFYRRKLNWLKSSDCLLAISDSVCREAERVLGRHPSDIFNISAACDDAFVMRDGAVKGFSDSFAKFCISRPFVMYTGGADERKNLVRLIEAFARLPQEVRVAHQLVIVGKMPKSNMENLSAVARRYGLASRDVVLTGYVTDSELIGLYRACRAFVFPSLHEGFGLPPLEAMNCGAAVIASNSTSIPEVVGNPEALFDPEAVESIAFKLHEVLADDNFRDRLLSRAKEQVKLFSWDESARRVISALSSGCSQVPSSPTKCADGYEDMMDALSSLPLAELSDRCLQNLAQKIADNEPRRSPPQLLLDISTLVHSDARTGIQRVVRALLKEFVERPPASYVVRPIMWAGDCYRYVNASARGGTAEAVGDGDVIAYWSGDRYLSLDLNMHLVDQLHPVHECMRRKGVMMNYIVYDIMLLTNPGWWRAPNPELFLKWVDSITQVADQLVCISNTVADELAEWLDTTNRCDNRGRPRICSFHLGADIESTSPSTGLPSDADDLLDKVRRCPSFLMVGTLEPRKGHAQILDAFEHMWALGVEVNLVIVGKPGWLVDDLLSRLAKHPNRGLTLFVLERVSDEFLERIYGSCSCLIAASYNEGFGLPLIEAAQHGMPILARDIPIFREVAQEYAFYFSGETSDDIALDIQKWLDHYANGEHTRSNGMPWLTWRQSARQLLDVLLLTEAVEESRLACAQ